jgi:SAM-dependent methyltransferase
MLDIITKKEYFSWLDQGYGTPKANTLKGIQDAFILSQLAGLENKKIAEIGGGQSRVLKILSKKNECWNVDKMEGVGQGPKDYTGIKNVKLIKTFIGGFSSDLTEEYFDIVFSISVVEHVIPENLPDFFKDMVRILKPGGLCIHAIDAYLGDSGYKNNQQIDIYKTVVKENCLPLEFIHQPKIDATSAFCCRYASNSDATIYGWNKIVPKIVDIRNNSQSVSIKAIWKKINILPYINKTLDFSQLNHLPQKVDHPEQARKIYEKNKDIIVAKIQHELDEAIKQDKKIVLIYQMGKVGSSTYKALLKKNNNYQVYHLHRMNYSSNEVMIENYINNGNVKLAIQEREWKEIANYILTKKPLLNVVTAVREPIARNISAYFQNLSESDFAKDTDGLIHSFLNNYPHTVPVNWFNEQFKKVFDIDIFDYPFNKNRGWDEIMKDNLNILTLTIETDDAEKINAFNRFFGLNVTSIPRANVANSKEYAVEYRKFIDTIMLKQDYIQRLLDTDIVRHFYKKSQIEQFYSKWLK